MDGLPHLAAVGTVQLLLLAVLPAWALARRPRRDAGEAWFAAAVAGVASAALLGGVCNGRILPGVALGIWFAGWGGAGLVLRRKAPPAPSRPDACLAAILVLAWLVRSLHPLQTWALDQSDAYSHLGFLQDVLARGKLANATYPPGYAWVQALSAWPLPMHPYWTARFGGAFFGTCLAVGTYAWVAEAKGRAAGLATALLVAGCPVFWLIQKTGVGCFANQAGLLLVVASLWAFSTQNHGFLLLSLGALAVTVPMMLLHVLLLLGLWTLSEPVPNRVRFRRLGLLGLAGAALPTLVATWMSASHGMVVATMLTGQFGLAATSDTAWTDVWRLLAGDFLAVKRWGYGSGFPNAAALASTALFVLAWAGGRRRRDVAWTRVGLWGLLTALNTHLGLFQFSEYQREGWSHLLALACLGGLFFDVAWQWLEGSPGQRALAWAWGVAGVAGLVFFPAHLPLQGPAESDWVRTLLELDPATTVLVRRTSEFPGGQGDLTGTLHPRTVHDAQEALRAQGPAVFLRDRPGDTGHVTWTMRGLQPQLARVRAAQMRKASLDNDRLEAALTGRIGRREQRTPQLELVWLRPAP